MEPAKRPPSDIITFLLWAGSGILIFTAVIFQTLNWNSGSEDKTSDWISAFGTAGGAVITGVALLIAALTYRHQAEERIRVQRDERQQKLDARTKKARMVKLNKTVDTRYHDTWTYTVRNDNPIAIDGVDFLVFDAMTGDPTLHQIGTVPGNGGEKRQSVFLPNMETSYLKFQDSEGRSWRRYFDNRLEEQPTTTSRP